MRCAHTVAMAIIALVLTVWPSVPSAQVPEIKQLSKELDGRNNYPALQGLKSATADVSCNILNQVVSAFPEAASAQVRVTFSWSRSSDDAWPETKFEISGVPKGQADLDRRVEVIRSVLQHSKAVVIEDPVSWTIGQTKANATQEGGRITVTGTGAQITNLKVEIDQATHQVQNMVMTANGAEYSFEMTREKVGDRWGVKSLVLSEPQTTRLINYEYAEANGFWLPKKIALEYKGTQEPAYVFEFSNWRVTTQPPAQSAS